jgi:SAM-dependent methyltransferase
MILEVVGTRIQGDVLEDGCGVGMYIEHLRPHAGRVFGIEYDFDRAVDASQRSDLIANCAGEKLPFPDDSFDVILSHEVIEHVADDYQAVREMVRVLRPAGRITLFCPNRGYPFETHGIYWRGKYNFGNKLFVNYLPRAIRDKLAPHVRVYTRRDLNRLFEGLPVKFVRRDTIFGAYDNIIARWPAVGRLLRRILQTLESTPLKRLGLSHFWVVEKLKG